MIKLERIITPIQLNPAFVKEQSDIFKATGQNVWNISWLKQALLELSNNKCCYCECDIKEESKYMEVEHFQDKNHYPDEVMEWSNLLPACKRCNGAKSNHDVIKDPIINPFLDIPSDHLSFRLYRFKKRDEKGKNTIDVVNLNHPERAVNKRYEVGQALEDLIDIAFDRLISYKENSLTIRKNKLLNIVENILKESQPISAYSATCATILHTSDVYEEIRTEMVTLGLWNSTFEYLHLKSLKLSLI